MATLEELQNELDDGDRLRSRMADLLTRTANALKGQPKPMHGHDWSDLPEVAERFGQYRRLRWGVQLRGQTVCAFVSRDKAALVAQQGSFDSGEPCEVVDLHTVR